MSRQRRNFSAKFKSDLVIELLKGEKDLNTLATENNIQPNLLRNWKKEFLDKASVVFDDKREDNLKEKLAEERKEKAEYAKKVGQLTMQVDWLKKKSEEICGPDYESKFKYPLLLVQNCLISIVQAFITRALLYQKKNCPARRSLIIFILTIPPGEQDKCLHN